MNASCFRNSAAVVLATLLLACDDQDLGDSLDETDSVAATNATTDLPPASDSSPSSSSSDTAADCSYSAISSCYDEAFATCAEAEAPELLCDARFECDVLMTRCTPSDWDEYEDWEQRVLDFIRATGISYPCGEWLDPCLVQARVYCELMPDDCGVYVSDCRELFLDCQEAMLDPGFGPNACELAPGACDAIEASICEVDPEQCSIVTEVCDWVPQTCS